MNRDTKRLSLILAFLGVLFALCVFSGRAQGGPDTVTLAWDPPTTNTDGSALMDLAGYNLASRTPPATNWTPQASTAAGVTSATVFLPRTLTEWAVNAYNSGGRTSDWSAVLAIINRVPGPPPKPHRK